MKTIKRILMIFFILITVSNVTLATQEEILQTQSETLNIKGFVSEANKYTEEVFGNTDVNTLLNNAIKGNIDNSGIISKIVGLFGKELKEAITVIRKYYCNNYST